MKHAARAAALIPVAIALAALAAPLPACAQVDQVEERDQDTQVWVYAVGRTELDEDTSLAVDFTQRWRAQSRGDEQRTARFAVLHQIIEGVKLGGGGGVFENESGRTELRPHQEINLSFGRFSARTRVEQRFFDGADRMELRVRQRIGYAQPIGGVWMMSVDGEYLGIAQSRERASARPRNQWRARAIFSAQVTETLSLGGAYLVIHTPRSGAPDRLNHVPQAYITLDF